jgi:cytoskeletal protein CcmA (bactofilin family)
VRGNISAEKLEIRSTGRVWGDVVTVAFSTEEGSFLRGQVRMEERVDLQLEPPEENPAPPPGSNGSWIEAGYSSIGIVDSLPSTVAVTASL